MDGWMEWMEWMHAPLWINTEMLVCLLALLSKHANTWNPSPLQPSKFSVDRAPQAVAVGVRRHPHDQSLNFGSVRPTRLVSYERFVCQSYAPSTCVIPKPVISAKTEPIGGDNTPRKDRTDNTGQRVENDRKYKEALRMTLTKTRV